MYLSANDEMFKFISDSSQWVVRIDVAPILVWTASVEIRRPDLTFWIGKVWVLKTRVYVEAESAVEIPMTAWAKESLVALGKYGVER